jgi:hypothetical protein
MHAAYYLSLIFPEHATGRNSLSFSLTARKALARARLHVRQSLSSVGDQSRRMSADNSQRFANPMDSDPVLVYA